MSQFDQMLPMGLDGSRGLMHPTQFYRLARRQSNRISKVSSTGNSPRKGTREDALIHSQRRFSTHSDGLAESFYAALQKATASDCLSTSFRPTNQSSRQTQTPRSSKRHSTNSQTFSAPGTFVHSRTFPAQQQPETVSRHSSFTDYVLPPRPLSYQEPECDWPTYLPIVSSDAIYPELSYSPQYETPRYNKTSASCDTTALSSPELFPYQQIPEPKTPPTYALDTKKADEVLMGVGLYDEPDCSWGDSSTAGRFRDSLINAPPPKPSLSGKGLKLEETFSPPPMEYDNGDNDSDDGDDQS
ncbi:hypothetical protein LOZ58_005152 [Ophidiomyces ophidiicola]|nr:hypothetical protein LOZ65_006443 [Ophidiomyces ophidiicola]KAI1935097.1 hypothetical protein LOZ66_005402 [Ophidiomyces ophidiicola]KAI1958420.1 hypothetical protein LOZ58_005152 [Ophidiomyces ophidiicola]